MTPDEHRAKAARIESSLAKCTRDEFEALIEGAMLAGTHWFNVALHELRIVGHDDDVMHAQYLPGHQRLRLMLLNPELLQAMDEIETARALFVRGNMPGGVEAAARCHEQLMVLRNAASRTDKISKSLLCPSSASAEVALE